MLVWLIAKLAEDCGENNNSAQECGLGNAGHYVHKQTINMSRCEAGQELVQKLEPRGGLSKTTAIVFLAMFCHVSLETLDLMPYLQQQQQNNLTIDT